MSPWPGAEIVMVYGKSTILTEEMELASYTTSNEESAVGIAVAQTIDTKNSRRQRILNHFGTWNDEDVKMINEIVQERANFSINNLHFAAFGH